MQRTWSEQEIKDGFAKFQKEFGRYPTSIEIDVYKHLPTSKTIQRRFGDVSFFREGIKFNRGDHRSETARMIDKRADEYEKTFRDFLREKYSIQNVHCHARIEDSRIMCDFFVYTHGSKGVAIDLFFAKNKGSLLSSIRFKQKKYENFPTTTVYLVVVGNKFSQSEIDDLLERRTNKLAPHIAVLTEQTMKSVL